MIIKSNDKVIREYSVYIHEPTKARITETFLPQIYHVKHLDGSVHYLFARTIEDINKQLDDDFNKETK